MKQYSIKLNIYQGIELIFPYLLWCAVFNKHTSICLFILDKSAGGTLYYFENILTIGSLQGNVNLKNSRNEIVFDRFWYPLYILLLVTIGAKLKDPLGGLQVDKNVTFRN